MIARNDAATARANGRLLWNQREIASRLGILTRSVDRMRAKQEFPPPDLMFSQRGQLKWDNYLDAH
jgi:hypothetical protein